MGERANAPSLCQGHQEPFPGPLSQDSPHSGSRRGIWAPPPLTDQQTLRPSLIREPLIFNKLWRCFKPSRVPLTCPKPWSPEKRNEMHHPSSFCCLSHGRPSPAPLLTVAVTLGFRKRTVVATPLLRAELYPSKPYVEILTPSN